jgi:rhodanese-related sulfurtransferase
MAVPRISIETLKERLDSGEPDAPIVVDVRLKYPYEHSSVSIPGAVRAAPPQFDCTALPKDRDIVTYDSDPEELVSAQVAARLIRGGYRASTLKGGIVEWLTAKYPTEEKSAPTQKPPTAGSLKG